MPKIEEKTSLRDLIGNVLHHNKIVFVVVLLLVVSISVFDIVPPIFSVPVSFVLIWLVSWLMRGKWSDLVVHRPKQIWNAIALGVSVGIVSEIFAVLVLIPLFLII